MAKKIKAKIKLQITGGQANPAPPVGPALGQHGLNIAEFCQKFNDQTRATRMGDVVPVEITVYDDRTYDFILKTAPAAELIKKAAGIKKGAAKPKNEVAGSITKAQLEEIAKTKMADLSAHDIEAAMNIIAGTARNMGVEVK